MATKVKYKGSLGPITAGFDAYEIARLKWNKEYVDLSTGSNTITIYLLSDSDDDIEDAVLDVEATFPVTGRTGDGWFQLYFQGTETEEKEGNYYYKLVWVSSTNPSGIVISKPEDVIELL